MTAELHIDQTSATAVRYQLVDQAGKRIWITRAYAHEAGHEGARRRLAAWATTNRVTVIERQPAELASSDRGRR